MAEFKHMHNIYDEVKNMGLNGAANRARGASAVMNFYGDLEMADTLRLLSGQLDFADSSESADAINRTNEKLDMLISDRKKRHASLYVKMLTDEQVLSMSSGEVTEAGYSFLSSSFLKGGSFDPAIFGGSGSIPVRDDKTEKYDRMALGTGMGHIELPCHVVLKSNYHIIADLLGMTLEDVEKLAKGVIHAVSVPAESGFHAGELVTDKQIAECSSEGAVFKTGGDAIYDMLKGLGYSDHPERLAFRMIPVIAPYVRPIMYSYKECTYYSYPLNGSYDRVILRARRLRHLMELEAPSIIIRNEARMLCEYVDELDECVKNASRSLKHYLNRNKPYYIFCMHQLAIADRKNLFNAVCISADMENAGSITSLGIYPETIKVKQDDGTLSDISLELVYDSCTDAIHDMQQEHAFVIPDGVDPDHLPPEMQAECDKVDELYNEMQGVIDAILEGAKKQREKFMVRKSDNGMYVPC